MKKIRTFLLALALSATLLTACGGPDTPSTGDNGADTNGLTAAKNYLYTMYKDAAEVTTTDFTRVGVVEINGVTYTVEWTANSDTITIVYGDDKMVTIDVDEANPEELTYTLTATLQDENGATESVSFTHKVPAATILDKDMTYEEIVDAAYALAEDTALEGTFRLFGTIVKINTPWSEDDQNITVTMQVGDMADKPILCYRLKGEGAKNLAVGDAITVEGTFKNYKGTIELDAGCILVGMGEIKDQTALLDAAYALADGIAMNEPCTMTGVISKIDTAWSDDYQNITVTMVVGGDTERPIMCYRLKGEGAKDLTIGDTITVTGILKNYKGTIEFDAGCTLDAVTKAKAEISVDVTNGENTTGDTENTDAPDENNQPTKIDMNDPVAVVNAAYALEVGASLPEIATLTGVISRIDSVWSDQHQNVTVTIVVNNMTEKPIMCYRLKGNSAKALAVGDTITVIGTLKNDNGTIEFDSGCTLVGVTKAESVDLAKFFDDVMAKAGEEYASLMMAADATTIHTYYPGLTNIATKQCVIRVAAISDVAAEVAMIECQNAQDIAAVRAILEARKASQVNSGFSDWEQAQIVVYGNYIALVVAGDRTAEVVDTFNRLVG